MNRVREARRLEKAAAQKEKNWNREFKRYSCLKAVQSKGQPEEIKDYKLARKLVKARRIFDRGGAELQWQFIATFDTAVNPFKEVLDRL